MKIINFIWSFYNNIDFFLRKHISFRRKYIIPFEEKNIEDYCYAKKEKELFFKYNLQSLKENSTTRNYLENLYIIELLEKYIPNIVSSKFINVLDIGSKDWFYVRGEYAFFKNFGKKFTLTGIEIDANRILANGCSRQDIAQAYIADLENANYISGDFLSHTESYNIITWFFPFLDEYPLLKWGLPLSTLKPKEMYKHSYNLLEKGGLILLVNQTEDEYLKQEKILNSLNIPYEKKGIFDNSFIEFPNKRYVTVVKKL